MIFGGGDSHLRVLLPEDLYNWLPGISALVVQEEIPSRLLVSCPSEGLPQLTQHHCVMVAYCNGLVLLLYSTDGTTLPGSTLRLPVPHHAHVETTPSNEVNA